MRYKAPSSEWTRCVSLIVNSKRYAYWPELGRPHFMFPQERNHPLRYAQVSAQRLRTKGPSRIRLVVIDRPSRRGWHRFIQLRNLSVGLQPKPRVLSVERTRSPRGSFAVTTPRLAAMAAVVPAVDKLRTLLAASFCFEPETSSPACSRIGASRLSYWSRDVAELAMDLRSPDLLVQVSLESGAIVFDVAAWLERVNKDEANVGSATMNPRDLMAHRLLR